MSSNLVPKKIDLTPRRHHGFSVVLFILGTLFPPLAVAARFGIGSDFWLNLLLTICGYIPGHGHNFYIQNIRNNKNHARTPKWAQRYGLVDTSEIRRKERKSQWANRYNDRLPHSAHEGQEYAEGQEAGSSLSLSSDSHDGRPRQQQNGGALWGADDEQYYNANNGSSSGGRWHYPANFEDAALPSSGSKRGKKKKEKKDRWARTEDAYSISEQQSRKRTKKKKSRTSLAPSTISGDDSTMGYPEDPEGGLYGNTQRVDEPVEQHRRPAATGDDVFDHQF